LPGHQHQAGSDRLSRLAHTPMIADKLSPGGTSICGLFEQEPSATLLLVKRNPRGRAMVAHCH
jgi:hypothetical protein